MSQFFTTTDYLMCLPIILLTLFAVGILLIDLMVPPEWKWTNAITALCGIAFSAVSVSGLPQVWLFPGTPGISGTLERLGKVALPAVSGAMMIDHFTVYFFYLFLAGAAISILMSVRYMEIEKEHHGEYYALMLFAVVGMMCMAAGYDIVLIFIGLELMAISTYVLVGFLRRDKRSNEAALKYLLLGAFSSGIFAYGLSLLYGLTGSTSLPVIRSSLGQQIHKAGGHPGPLLIVALLTTAVGLFFKIAAIPFHQWLPDAYEGAPTSITGFMSVAVKAAAWAMLLRILLWGLYPLRSIWVPLVIFVSIATMTGANLAALTQTNLKRLLAYSSMAHVGYMLLGLVALGSVIVPAPAFFDGFKGILLYLLVYTFMNLGAFAVVASLRQRDIIGDEIDDIAGLYFRAPTEAVLMLIFLLSLAGIPPLAGFYGKYFIFLSLIESGHYVLAGLGVAYSVFGLYYYLKVANAMFMREPATKERLQISLGMKVALAVTAFATVVIGIFPERFVEAINWSLKLG
ncbi:MAG TPA: NADH-quinone oxidoreductase subunit N [Terriglobales bacterium]|jgi:NADH-quinone oxidoreductase subunit N|nr:NADH-quinone oxidoreductase subunit N [Terriglobales bacterium]